MAILTAWNVDDRLKEEVGKAADRADMPMNEWIAKALASALKMTHLGKIKRKRPGRPRKELAK